jgi:pyruvate, orthophosphate dikinase
MFLGERQALLQRLILADTAETRDAALAELIECQRVDFTALLRETEGMPATIRLLDPPLHEFLPDRTTLAVEVALARAADQAIPEREKLLAAVERLHETNPMLGMRGVRLGLLLPELFATQVRALAEATASLIRDGQSPHVEIMVPLIASAAELRLIREPIERAITEVAQRTGAPLTIPIGTMIELPRAALTAHDIAQAAEFFSFGTNDLTQTTWGLSRDDVQTALIAAYQEQGVFSASPFDTLDRDGVGVLIDKAVTAGRAARHDLTLGICGEHGADPDSVHFFHAHGLDYVSCSPNRIPIARLEAGRAALLATPHQPAHP